MVVPVATAALANPLQVITAVGIKALFRQPLQLLPLDFERLIGDPHQVGNSGKETLGTICLVSCAWQVQSDNTDRPCQWVGAKQAAAATSQFTVVQP